MIKINNAFRTLQLLKRNPSVCLSSTLKSEINYFFDNKNDPHIENIKKTTHNIHDMVQRSKYIDYEIAKLKGTTYAQTKNLNYGIVGLSLMLFFGSVTLSIHPIFFGGFAIGALLYRKVSKQSTSQYILTDKLDSFVSESKLLKSNLVDQINYLESQLTMLETGLKNNATKQIKT